MEKIKIAGICSVLALILTACGPKGITETSKPEGPGFEYNTPDGTIQDKFEINIDYNGNDILKDFIKNNTELTKEKTLELLDILDTNPLKPSKGNVLTEEYIMYDLNEDGNFLNDVGNKDIKQTFNFVRNNETHSKTGKLTHKETSIVLKNNAPFKVEKNITDGTYSLTVDVPNYKILESYEFKDAELDVKNEYFLNETNLRKQMQVINLQGYKQYIVRDAKKWEKDNPKETKLVSEKNDTEIMISLTKTIKLENVKNEEQYNVVIDLSGYVKKAEWSNVSLMSTANNETYDQVLEKHSSIFTFEL